MCLSIALRFTERFEKGGKEIYQATVEFQLGISSVRSTRILPFGSTSDTSQIITSAGASWTIVAFTLKYYNDFST